MYGIFQRTYIVHAYLLFMCMVRMSIQASPMKLQYSTQWEQYLTQEIVDEMVSVVLLCEN